MIIERFMILALYAVIGLAFVRYMAAPILAKAAVIFCRIASAKVDKIESKAMLSVAKDESEALGNQSQASLIEQEELFRLLGNRREK